MVKVKKLTISDDNPTKTCAKCGSVTRRLYYQYDNIQYKGGWCIACIERT